MSKINTLIQQNHTNAGKMVLQALIPFVSLKDTVLFTCKANPQNSIENDYSAIAEENYKYYQRRIDEKRLSRIETYIRNSILSENKAYSITALFPSSLILAVNEDDGNLVDNITEESCTLTLSNNIFIVDGQHRMMAMKSLYTKLSSALFLSPEDEIVLYFLNQYKFNCVILVNYDLWEQGQVFVNVNFNQKPVNKSLYYEVFGSQYNADPNSWKQNHVYLAHNLTKVLNDRKESPYHNRIKMIGSGKGYISQAFFVEALMKNFSLNGIWSIYKSSKEKDTKVRYMAVELLSFFIAVHNVFKPFWPKDGETEGTIICKTTGTGAFVRLMKDVHNDAPRKIIDSLNIDGGYVSSSYVDHVKGLLERVPKTKREQFFGKKSAYAGSSGKGSEAKLYKELRSIIFNNQLFEDNTEKSLPVNEIAEQLQEYLWTHVEAELDCLGQRYEFDDLMDLRVDSFEKTNDATIECKVSFDSGITIYMDNEDETGFSMSFPTTASLVIKESSGKWVIDEDSVIASFDTSKYYE